MIEVNIPERRLSIVGIKGEPRAEGDVEAALAERRRHWTPAPPRHATGILSLYSRVAGSTSDGAAIT